MPKRRNKKIVEKERLAKRAETIQKRQQKQKERLIEKMSEQPNVSIASRLANVPRANFYRWIKEDQDFKDKVAEAMELGIEQINDLAEMKLIQLIKEGNLSAIKHWLMYNNHRYGKVSIPKILSIFDEISLEKKKEIAEAIESFLGLTERAAKGEDLRNKNLDKNIE